MRTSTLLLMVGGVQGFTGPRAPQTWTGRALSSTIEETVEEMVEETVGEKIFGLRDEDKMLINVRRDGQNSLSDASNDAFGFADEDQMLNARRQGQDSFEDVTLASAAAGPGDAIFGFSDEDLMTSARREGQNSIAKITGDVFGFEDEAAMLAARRDGQNSMSDAADNVFGFSDEAAMAGAKRAGQSTFLGDGAAGGAAFGYADEAAMLGALRQGQDSFAEVDAFGFAAEAQPRGVVYAGATCAVDDAAAATAAAAVAPRAKSVALPFVERPAGLDAALAAADGSFNLAAGDAGFDPLNLAAGDALRLADYRDAELKHGRLAMLAALGWPVSELAHPGLAKGLGLPSVVAPLGGDAPSVLNGGLDATPPTFWVAGLLFAGALELQGMTRRAAGAAPGDLGFDPLALGGARMADAELANSRLAMLAIVGFAAQELSARLAGVPVPVVGQTPGFFHPLPFW